MLGYLLAFGKTLSETDGSTDRCCRRAAFFQKVLVSALAWQPVFEFPVRLAGMVQVCLIFLVAADLVR